MKRRLLAWVLSFALALSLLPVGVLAAGEIYSGSCGENVTWDFDGVGTLSIMGTGAMYNYADSNSTSLRICLHGPLLETLFKKL